MSQVIDLTGQVFGRLTVLERIEDYVAPSGSHHVNWRCLCSCPAGTIVNVTTPCLRGGNTRSCGCLRADMIRERRLIDLVGQRFGKLVVFRRSGTKVFPSGQTQPVWDALCEYGQMVSVLGCHLRSGHTTNCGKLCRSVEIPTYSAAHNRVRRSRGSASDLMCIRCHVRWANDWCYNWAADIEITDELGRTYSADVWDYDPRCWRCHRAFDAVMSLFAR